MGGSPVGSASSLEIPHVPIVFRAGTAPPVSAFPIPHWADGRSTHALCHRIAPARGPTTEVPGPGEFSGLATCNPDRGLYTDPCPHRAGVLVDDRPDRIPWSVRFPGGSSSGVERHVANVVVVGSNPISRSIFSLADRAGGFRSIASGARWRCKPSRPVGPKDRRR